jgi:hypothetical protein
MDARLPLNLQNIRQCRLLTIKLPLPPRLPGHLLALHWLPHLAAGPNCLPGANQTAFGGRKYACRNF